jgi:hypothetical protein
MRKIKNFFKRGQDKPVAATPSPRVETVKSLVPRAAREFEAEATKINTYLTLLSTDKVFQLTKSLLNQI